MINVNADWRLLAVAAGVVAALVYVAKKQVGVAANEIGAAVNPLSTNNIFYGGVNAVGGVVAQDNSWTLGGWLYDALHPNATKADASSLVNLSAPHGAVDLGVWQWTAMNPGGASGASVNPAPSYLDLVSPGVVAP